MDVCDFDSSGSTSSDSFSSSFESDSSSDDERMLVDSVEEALLVATTILDDLEMEIEDKTIRWRSKHDGGVMIEDLTDDDAISHFRFRKPHLQEVADKLWPRLREYLAGSKTFILFNNGNYSAPYETLFLMLLFRFSRPRRIRKEMESFFCYRRSKISAGIRAMADALYALSICYLDNPQIYHERLAYYAERVYAKCGLVQSVWGFIDGTLRKTCRPSFFQKLLYSGHKQAHGIKFQSVVLPDGLFACMFGPITGNRHDSYMLAKSQLIPKLRQFMPEGDVQQGWNANGEANDVFSLYGDAAYPQSTYLFGGYRNPQPGSPEARWNTEMSKVREVVEWGFCSIASTWAFLDFRPSMRIFKSPIAKFYIIGAFLVNLRTCFYGNQTMEYFDSDVLMLDEYLSLID